MVERVDRIFVFGHLRDDDPSRSKKDSFSSGSLAVDGFVRGARLFVEVGSSSPLVVLAPSSREVVAGRCLSWGDQETFIKKLKEADRIECFRDDGRGQALKSVVTVETAQGVTLRAYMYHHRHAVEDAVHIKSGDWLKFQRERNSTLPVSSFSPLLGGQSPLHTMPPSDDDARKPGSFPEPTTPASLLLNALISSSPAFPSPLPSQSSHPYPPFATPPFATPDRDFSELGSASPWHSLSSLKPMSASSSSSAAATSSVLSHIKNEFIPDASFGTAEDDDQPSDGMGLPPPSVDADVKQPTPVKQAIAADLAPHGRWLNRRTGFVYDERMKKHFETSLTHPEAPERISAIYERLQEDGLIDRCIRIDARHVTDEELQLVHSPDYVAFIRGIDSRQEFFNDNDDAPSVSGHSASDSFPSSPPFPSTPASLTGIPSSPVPYSSLNTPRFGPLTPRSRIHSAAKSPMTEEEIESSGFIGNSIYTNNHSGMCASLAAGSVCAITERVVTGELLNGIAIVRPPGHHAESHEANGFCLFNNVAVAAALAVNKLGLDRVLIVDWDVHHGNGTQNMFWNDPRVLYFSVHRWDKGLFYPGGDAGGPEKAGRAVSDDSPISESSWGKNVNVGWNTYNLDNDTLIGDADYLAVWHHVLLPIVYEYGPQLIFISAGFDAARGDPLGHCDVTPAGYAHLTHLLMGVCSSKIVLALEGGYDLDAISRSFSACTAVLLGEPPPPLEWQLPPGANKAASITAATDTLSATKPNGFHEHATNSLPLSASSFPNSSSSARPSASKLGYPARVRRHACPVAWQAIRETLSVHSRLWECLGASPTARRPVQRPDRLPERRRETTTNGRMSPADDDDEDLLSDQGEDTPRTPGGPPGGASSQPVTSRPRSPKPNSNPRPEQLSAAVSPYRQSSRATVESNRPTSPPASSFASERLLPAKRVARSPARVESDEESIDERITDSRASSDPVRAHSPGDIIVDSLGDKFANSSLSRQRRFEEDKTVISFDVRQPATELSSVKEEADTRRSPPRKTKSRDFDSDSHEMLSPKRMRSTESPEREQS